MWPFPSNGICVLDWSKWKPMLIMSVAPDARRIRARFGEHPERLLLRLPRRTDRLLVHLDISQNSPFIPEPTALEEICELWGIQLLNCGLRDIRKRTVQAACITHRLPSLAAPPDGPADELLIVKSNLNAGGVPELMLPAAQKARFNLGTQPRRMKSPKDYFIAPRASLAPEIWNDPELVIERFVTNPEGRFFRAYILKSSVVVSEGYSPEPIKRMRPDVQRRNHWLWRYGTSIVPYHGSNTTLPRALLRTLGVFVPGFRVDYGAIDIIESEAHEFHIIDVNKTPYWGSASQPGLLEHLRLGLIGATPPKEAGGTQAA
jgi:hypothetical protein